MEFQCWPNCSTFLRQLTAQANIFRPAKLRVRPKLYSTSMLSSNGQKSEGFCQNNRQVGNSSAVGHQVLMKSGVDLRILRGGGGLGRKSSRRV